MVDLANNTAKNIQSHDITAGTLSIGAGESIGMQRILDVVGDIIKDYPKVDIKLVSGDAFDIEKKLEKGVLDFAIFMGKYPSNNYDYLKLPESDEWGLVMREDDKLAKKSSINPEELINLPIILSEQSLKENRFQNWLGNLEPKLNVIGTTNLIFNASLLVLNKSAYLMSFKGLVDSRQNNLIFKPLKPKLFDPIIIAWKKNTVQSKVAKLFINRMNANLENDK
ncbi:LysR family transcriptional regulator substrate-binding protein [Lactobacillus sp. S2-2]|uniref:LysR family transcriptional regulator substrate-binding protein n=1 Tax=Lactobacillus sp. S2-2 TaxID=2692917 RepID=UPI001F473930|nr:LysR family transcriptional regulator substrate-binding protein [Lactobacillus sp. S2-2]